MMPNIVHNLWNNSPTKGAARLVLLAIGMHATHEGTGAYPSIATLKRFTRLSHSQVCLSLRQLEGGKHLEIAPGAGPGKTNLYTILRPWDPSYSPVSSPTVGHATVAHAMVGHPTVGHATAAHPTVGHPTIGPNQTQEEEKDKICVSTSDMQPSDVLPSDYPAPPSPPVEVCKKGVTLLNSWVSPHFSQVCQGKEPDSLPPEDLTPEPPPADLSAIDTPAEPLEDLTTSTMDPEPLEAVPTDPPPTPRARAPRNPAAYRLGKLCPRGHDHEGTGLSLRRMPGGSCVDCEALRQRERDLAKNPNPRAHKPYAWKTQMESERVIFQPGEAPQRHREYRPNKERLEKASNGVAVVPDALN